MYNKLSGKLILGAILCLSASAYAQEGFHLNTITARTLDKVNMAQVTPAAAQPVQVALNDLDGTMPVETVVPPTAPTVRPRVTTYKPSSMPGWDAAKRAGSGRMGTYILSFPFRALVSAVFAIGFALPYLAGEYDLVAYKKLINFF